ncbi:MAG TPA: biopolymer transporter ExbD [Gemmatimonadota bacterium]|nr:biopolymer transporter ExbD [Gemmatimonadota bacterium]
MPSPLHRENELLSQINVTSLVDVTIVLLIMFMIIAPISQGGIEVRVPQTESAPLASSEAITVSMDDEGRVFVDRTEIRPEALGQVLQQIRESQGTERVYVRADAANPYGRVMEMMGQLREAGFENVGLVTEPPPGRRER